MQTIIYLYSHAVSRTQKNHINERENEYLAVKFPQPSTPPSILLKYIHGHSTINILTNCLKPKPTVVTEIEQLGPVHYYGCRSQTLELVSYLYIYELS